ncbi:tyrosine-type recombinase/integrase [Streptomyces sp. NPDC020299]|uniref:tyrosine-type recombinase/integrase n=1 Tax=Streptomyces sp. NPDC020299 TaxID=3365067 RepID=UPI0037989E16
MHLPGWGKKLTPHVLRHFCASQLYGSGLDLLAIQEVLGHSWIAATMRCVHVQQTRVEDARGRRRRTSGSRRGDCHTGGDPQAPGRPIPPAGLTPPR